MSRIDSECFPPTSSSNEQVCAGCFKDADLRRYIRTQEGPRGCSLCGRRSAPTAPIGELAEYIADRLLDLATPAPAPGFFSAASRRERQGYRFLHAFADLIAERVAGDDRTHIDHIPTQVLIEFLRDFSFKGMPIDGVRYRTATSKPGANAVLFATQTDICDRHSEEHLDEDQARPWLRFASVKHLELAIP